MLAVPSRSAQDSCPCTWALAWFCVLKGAACWPQAPGDGSDGPSDANGRQASSSQAAVAGDCACGCTCWLLVTQELSSVCSAVKALQKPQVPMVGGHPPARQVTLSVAALAGSWLPKCSAACTSARLVILVCKKPQVPMTGRHPSAKQLLAGVLICLYAAGLPSLFVGWLAPAHKYAGLCLVTPRQPPGVQGLARCAATPACA